MRRLVVPLCLVLGAAGHSPAQSIWSGAGADNHWTTDANWSGGSSPYHSTGPNVVLNSTAAAALRNTVLDQSLSANSLSINASGYTV